MTIFDTHTEARHIIRYRDKYLKIDNGHLVGAYIGDRGSSLKPYAALFKQYVFLTPGEQPKICFTIAYWTEEKQYYLAVSPQQTLEFKPVTNGTDISSSSSEFKRYLFKWHRAPGGLLTSRLESLSNTDLYLFYNCDTNRAELWDLSPVPNIEFKIYRCPRNITNQPTRIHNITDICLPPLTDICQPLPKPVSMISFM